MAEPIPDATAEFFATVRSAWGWRTGGSVERIGGGGGVPGELPDLALGGSAPGGGVAGGTEAFREPSDVFGGDPERPVAAAESCSPEFPLFNAGLPSGAGDRSGGG